jgi:hypothetical protein
MPDNRQQITGILRKLKLFAELDEAELDRVASFIKPLSLPAGETRFLDGKNCPFYIVITGSLHYNILKRGAQKDSYILKPGDFFGADVVFHGKAKEISLVAESASLLFSLSVEDLRFVLNTTPLLTRNVKKQLAWYNLIRSKPFAWLGEQETVKVICRKHPAYLLILELAPLVLAWTGVLVILAASQIGTSSFRLVVGWLGAGLVGVAALWAVYRYYDWGNDYYIITDQRIVWLERTIGVYDSRQEAPLVAIKSGETKSSQAGRWLGFGDVITETFMGQIFFRHIGNPAEIKSLIDHEHNLAINRQTATDIHAIEGKIRQKIEPSQAATVPMASGTPAPESPVSSVNSQETRLVPEKLGFWQALLARFQMRREANGMITYRKHLYVLFRLTLVPAGCVVGSIYATSAVYFLRVDGKISLLTPGLIFLIGAGLMFMSILWWLYRFIDWSNDIYRLTPEKIIDSERRPLGTEITKSAPLENIIGLEYEQHGFLGVALNFGNVVINIGTENKFIFYGIHNPARAQRDIFNYMYERRQKKQQDDTLQEQERVSNYIAVYHRQAQDLRQAKKPPQI